MKLSILTVLLLILPIASHAFEPYKCKPKGHHCVLESGPSALVGYTEVKTCWRWWPTPIGCVPCKSEVEMNKQCNQRYSDCKNNCKAINPNANWATKFFQP